MALSIFIILIGAVMLVAFVFWLMYLIEAVQYPDAQWDAAGQNKLLHVLLMVFLGIIGTIVYAVTARPALKNAG